ncbi:hypothetical protein [Leisingera sp. M523]|uniref:hypothetical protein n=1 Tax=Leisingera sp. M523 TaxID=2867013 RepID=UPI0021A6668B|nr:hypothetical protein [Leisingera sp. M523]
MALDQPGEAINAGVEPEELVKQRTEDPIRRLGHVRLNALEMAFGKGGHGLGTGWQDTFKLAQQAADHVRDMSSLADNEFAGAVDRQQRLLVFRLDLGKSRSAPLNDPLDRSIHWRGPA